MNCTTHTGHDHQHGESCGHKGIKHDDHVDYLHDGHLHFVHGDHVDEHVLSGATAQCTPDHQCQGHESGHAHGPSCGHAAVPHDNHVDYVVAGHLHSPCKEHCDNHGELAHV